MFNYRVRIFAGVQLQQPGIQPGDGRCRQWGSLSVFFWTACLFQAYDSLLYFYKNIRPEAWHFQFPLSQIYYLHKSLLLFKQSSCFNDSLGISLEVKLLSRVQLLWPHGLYVVCQAPPSMGFSRQEYCSGLPFPSPGDLPNPGIKPKSPALWAGSLLSEP